MISNERQYAKSQRSLVAFKAQLEEARREYGNDPGLFSLRSTQLVRYIEELEAEIADYDQATRGELAPVMPAFNPRSGRLEIGRALVKLRLAKGLTQEELAQQLGTHQPSITRWENEENESYRLCDLRRVAGALGRDLDVVFVDRGQEPAVRGLDEALDQMLDQMPELKAALAAGTGMGDLRDGLKQVCRTLAEEMAIAEVRRKEVG